MISSRFAICLAALLFGGTAYADHHMQLPASGDNPDVTTAQFEEWLSAVSNWGRWGDDDQLGTLNLITPEKRKAAAALGKSVV